jgi:hypothetical protein
VECLIIKEDEALQRIKQYVRGMYYLYLEWDGVISIYAPSGCEFWKMGPVIQLVPASYPDFERRPPNLVREVCQRKKNQSVLNS